MKKQPQEYLPVTVLQQRINDLNEGIRKYAAFLTRKGRASRWSMTKQTARKKMRLMQTNRDSLKVAIKQLQAINVQRRIKFVYYNGNVCRVIGVSVDYAGKGDRSSLMVECDAAIPSYRFLVTKDQYKIAAYWD